MVNNFIFTGHESFSLREGWLTKGINAIKEIEKKGNIGKDIFSQGEIYNTIDELGIGSNMVKSLKYWLEVFDILLNNGSINPLIDKIIEFDKYFQNKETLWILHFLIFNPKRQNRKPLLWEIISSKNNYNSFELNEMKDLIDSETGKRYSSKSIESTLYVFIKTYYYDYEIENSKDPETNLVSPFTKLKLLIKHRQRENEFMFREVEYTELNIFLAYFMLKTIFESKNVSRMEIKEAYHIFKKMIKMNSYNFDMLLKNIENQNLISVDRAAGLNNINILNKETDYKLIEKIYK